MPNTTLYRIIWIPSAIALVGTVGAFAMQPAKPTQVDQLTAFTSSDKYLAIQKPEGWTAHNQTVGGNYTEIWFKPAKNIYFQASSDLQGSLMGDIAKSSNAQMSNMASMADNGSPEASKAIADIQARQKSPLQQVHEADRPKHEKDLEGYEEGATEKTRLNNIEALSTDFTWKAPGLFSSTTLVGKRYTALANDRRVAVIYYCPKDAADKLLPVFGKMAASLQVGTGQ